MPSETIEKTASPPKRRRRVRRVDPVLLNQQEAGDYLGKSYEWLRQESKKHDLYRPSDGKSTPGVASRYHRAHLDLIVMHLLDPGLLPEDKALLAWQCKRDNALREAYAEIDRAIRGSAEKAARK